MNLAPLRSLAREINFSTHGVSAVVTIPGGSPVTTTVIWLTPVIEPSPPGDFGRSEARRSLAIPRDDLPAVPRGTRIAVTEHLQASPSSWAVDSMDAIFHDHHRVNVVPAGA